MKKYIPQPQSSARHVSHVGEAVEFGDSRLDPKIDRDVCNRALSTRIAPAAIFQIQSPEEHRFEEWQDGWEIRAGRIHLANEQKIVDAVIAALADRYKLVPGDFEVSHLIRPKAADKPVVTLSLSVRLCDDVRPRVDPVEVAGFCERELIRRMPAVLESSKQIAAGVLPAPSATSTKPAATSTVGSDTEPHLIEVLNAGMEDATNDPAERARTTLAQQLVARLGGKTMRPMRIEADGSAHDIQGRIATPQRKPRAPVLMHLYGYLNALCVDPATCEVLAEEESGVTPRTKWKLNYSFDKLRKTFADLHELLGHGAAIRIRFDVERHEEISVAAGRKSYKLVAWQRE